MKCFARSALAVLAGMTVLLCVGCGNEPNGDGDITAQTEYSFTTAYETIVPVETAGKTTATAAVTDTAVQPADSGVAGSFRTAVWLAKDEVTEAERYFLFLDDSHGKVIEQQNGQETGFTYTVSGTQATLQIETDGGKAAAAYWTDANHAVLRQGEERTELLTLLQEDSHAPFHFYTNDQLCAMALEDYAARHGVRPAKARTYYNLDETIAIQLYDGEGSSSETYTWYNVDRYTAEGSSLLNESLALAGTPDASAPAQTTVQTTAPAPETTVPQTSTLPPVETVAETLPPPPETEPPTEALPADDGMPETFAENF